MKACVCRRCWLDRQRASVLDRWWQALAWRSIRGSWAMRAYAGHVTSKGQGTLS